MPRSSRRKRKAQKSDKGMSWKILVFYFLAAALVFFFVLKMSKKFQSVTPANPGLYAIGGESLDIQLDTPVFLQGDRRWGEIPIGGTGKTIRSAGSTLCCTAMAMNAVKIETDPAVLNQAMINMNGYTGRGEVIWDNMNLVEPRVIHVDISDQPNHHEIDRCLGKKIPVIAMIRIDGKTDHWVLITGKANQEYLIHDPLGSEEGFEPISKYRSLIYRTCALRTVEY